MAVPQETVWEIKPHTVAKHTILREYLKAWIPILAKHNRRVVYLDGFAGPGKYKGGEPGSPTVAMRCALLHRARIKQMTFLFVEKDEERIEHLKSHLQGFDPPSHFNLQFFHGEFEEEVAGVLNWIEREGKSLAPTFAFIDPFGEKGIPMNLLHRILRHERTEVFTNFAVGSANRHKAHPNEKVRENVHHLLGGEVPDPRPQESSHDALRRRYKERLGEAASYVRSFKMLGDDHKPIYDLFFGSNNAKGHEKMKEAMWKAAPDGNFQFSDATDEKQLVMFKEEPEPQLLEKVMEHFGDSGRTNAKTVERWILDETAFLKRHKTEALKLGENEGRFYVENQKADGSTRRKGTFPEGAMIDFSHTRPGEQQSLF